MDAIRSSSGVSNTSIIIIDNYVAKKLNRSGQNTEHGYRNIVYDKAVLLDLLYVILRIYRKNNGMSPVNVEVTDNTRWFKYDRDKL